MAKSKINSLGGLVYSTDPAFKIPSVEPAEGETLAPPFQKMVVSIDKKHRAGKAVTIVQNFVGAVADQEELGRKLKAFCGTGGSVKDGDIIIQGDNKDKVLQWLIKNGYTLSKKR